MREVIPTLERKLWVALFVADSKEIDRQLGNTIEGFTLNSPKARFEEAPDGTPYVILPSTTVVKLRSGDRLKVFSPFLALLEDGAWYLINVGFGGLMGSVKGLVPVVRRDRVRSRHTGKIVSSQGPMGVWQISAVCSDDSADTMTPSRRRILPTAAHENA